MFFPFIRSGIEHRLVIGEDRKFTFLHTAEIIIFGRSVYGFRVFQAEYDTKGLAEIESHERSKRLKRFGQRVVTAFWPQVKHVILGRYVGAQRQ